YMKKFLVFVLIIAVLAVLYVVYKPEAQAPTDSIMPAMEGQVEDLVDISIEPGATVSSGQTITGTLKNGYFFEANAVGFLVDTSKNVLDQFPIAATSDWMTADGVSFEFTLDYTDISGPGYIRIHNDNASGDPMYDKYVDIPV